MVALAIERTLPLTSAVDALFPAGLRRGSTVAVTGPGATTMGFALVAAASVAGSWCAAVGFPDLGVAAVAELGVSLERLALVPSLPAAQWTGVVGALLDTVELVIARPPRHLRLGDARRLTARARERGAVLIVHGAWAEGAEVRLTVNGSSWTGPGAGDGHLMTRTLSVTTGGRGAAARPRCVDVAVA